MEKKNTDITQLCAHVTTYLHCNLLENVCATIGRNGDATFKSYFIVKQFPSTLKIRTVLIRSLVSYLFENCTQ